MTDTPSDAAIEEALRLINSLETREGVVWTTADAYLTTIRALALRLDFEDRVARELDKELNGYGHGAGMPIRAKLVRSLMLPDPVDPDEELARAFHDAYEALAPEFGYSTRKDTRQFDPQSLNGKLMLATIKRLREQGRLTDAK